MRSVGDCSPGGTPALAGLERPKQPSAKTSVADHTAVGAGDVDADEQRRDVAEVLRVPDARLRDEHHEQHA